MMADGVSQLSEYEFHPIAGIFPLMEGDEFRKLVEDVRAHGVREPAWLYEGKILDGRNRYRAAQEVGAKIQTREFFGAALEAIEFVWSLNRTRRHLNSSQAAIADARRNQMTDAYAPVREAAKERQVEAGKNHGRGQEKVVEQIPQPIENTSQRAVRYIKEDAPPKTRDIRAKAAGTNPKYINIADRLVDERPDLAQQVESGKKTISQVTRELRREENEEALRVAVESIDPATDADIRHCSMAELFASGIRPDVVITDPPYPKEYVHLYEELAQMCADAGVPLIAAMAGQSYLPEIYTGMSRHLRYRWTLAYLTPGGQAVQQWQAKANTFWKPILLFGDAGDWIGDVCKSSTNDNDKRFHHWGQSESGMLDLVQRLSKPGDLICDPFMGAGTTAVAALAAGRRFIGCDIDEAHVQTARGRCAMLKEAV